MTLRFLTVMFALTLLVVTGCRTTSRYQPPCPPAVVATAPVAPCPPGAVPPAPVLPPR
jgi:hypothetical protein